MDVVKSKILWSRKKRITRVSRLHSTLHFPTRIALRAVVRKREPRGSLREEIFFREEYWGGKAVGWKKVFIIILFNTKKTAQMGISTVRKHKLLHHHLSQFFQSTVWPHSISGQVLSNQSIVSSSRIVSPLLFQHPSQSQQAASRVQRVMSTFCEVTRGFGDTWATCPTLHRGIWDRNKRARFRCCG